MQRFGLERPSLCFPFLLAIGILLCAAPVAHCQQSDRDINGNGKGSDSASSSSQRRLPLKLKFKLNRDDEPPGQTSTTPEPYTYTGTGTDAPTTTTSEAHWSTTTSTTAVSVPSDGGSSRYPLLTLASAVSGQYESVVVYSIGLAGAVQWTFWAPFNILPLPTAVTTPSAHAHFLPVACGRSQTQWNPVDGWLPCPVVSNGAYASPLSAQQFGVYSAASECPPGQFEFFNIVNGVLSSGTLVYGICDLRNHSTFNEAFLFIETVGNPNVYQIQSYDTDNGALCISAQDTAQLPFVLRPCEDNAPMQLWAFYGVPAEAEVTTEAPTASTTPSATTPTASQSDTTVAASTHTTQSAGSSIPVLPSTIQVETITTRTPPLASTTEGMSPTPTTTPTPAPTTTTTAIPTTTSTSTPSSSSTSTPTAAPTIVVTTVTTSTTNTSSTTTAATTTPTSTSTTRPRITVTTLSSNGPTTASAGPTTATTTTTSPAAAVTGYINLTITDSNPHAFLPICSGGVWGLYGITLNVWLTLGLFGGGSYSSIPLTSLLANAAGQTITMRAAFFLNDSAVPFHPSQIFNVANSSASGNVWSFQLEDWQAAIGGSFTFSDAQPWACSWQSQPPRVTVAFSTDGQTVIGTGSPYGGIPAISAFPNVRNQVESKFIAKQQQ